jgi:hypothetical protein
VCVGDATYTGGILWARIRRCTLAAGRNGTRTQGLIDARWFALDQMRKPTQSIGISNLRLFLLVLGEGEVSQIQDGRYKLENLLLLKVGDANRSHGFLWWSTTTEQQPNNKGFSGRGLLSCTHTPARYHCITELFNIVHSIDSIAFSLVQIVKVLGILKTKLVLTAQERESGLKLRCKGGWVGGG